MKEKIVAVQCRNYNNRMEIVIARQPDSQHLGHCRIYSALYTQPIKCMRLVERYISILGEFTRIELFRNLEKWQ